MGEPLVVWDFDWSLVNENSDVYVIEALEGHGGPVWTQAVLQWRESGGKLPGGWTALMDSCVENLWAAGVREPEFTEALGGIPMLSGADKVCTCPHRHTYMRACVRACVCIRVRLRGCACVRA
jgi:hypothetical protein